MENEEQIPAPGEGMIQERNGQPVALYRDPAGQLHGLSGICTHEECSIEWSTADKLWECPCHGSRFTPDGHVVDGPAIEPLPPVDIS
jgi:Rieske Fe-S protein